MSTSSQNVADPDAPVGDGEGLRFLPGVLDAALPWDIRPEATYRRVESWMSANPFLKRGERDKLRASVGDLLVMQRPADVVLMLLDALDSIDSPHVLEVTSDGWSVQHSLECRPAMQDCPIHRAAEEAAPFWSPGRWKVEIRDGNLVAVEDARTVE